jgi:CubicO group peptidase (beta-lactamase class C family)
LARAIPVAVRGNAAFANRRDVLSAEIPSMGTMSARGAARLYAAMLGQVDGFEPVSAARRAQFAATAFEGRDEVMEMETSWALGYSQFRPAGSRPGSTFGMVGMNGSGAYADVDSGVAVAVMRNRFDPELKALATVDRIVKEECDGAEER